jgi:cell division protein FtsA
LTKNNLVVGLDIGTTKICCIVAEIDDGGTLIVSGVGVSPSEGLKRGVVVDIEATTRAVEEAVSRASQQSGREITSAFVGVTGEHISSLNSRGVTAITHTDREIRPEDVERAEQQAKVIVIPPDREILHALPRSYSVDGQNGIKHPVGISGTRLEVESHIVTGATTFLQNVVKCVTRAGLAVDELVLEPLATAEAVILPGERSLGVCLVDIGGGTTDMAVFQEGEIYYSAVVPVGGNHVTSDISQLLRMTLDQAEALKKDAGSAILSGIRDTDLVKIQQIGQAEPRHFKRRALAEIIEARMQELFHLVEKEIEKSGCSGKLPAGIVLTGGGSELHGALECAAQVLQLPVRRGKPAGLAGLGESVASPAHSTAVGLVQFGARGQQHGAEEISGGPGLLARIFQSFTGLFSRFKVH